MTANPNLGEIEALVSEACNDAQADHDADVAEAWEREERPDLWDAPDVTLSLPMVRALLASHRRQREEIEDLRLSVQAFCGPWAVQYARDHGLPEGHLFPCHYDILERAGARMVDFTRHAEGASDDR